MSRPDPHIIGLCPSTSYLLQMYIKSRMNKQPEKKTTVFTKKICKFKTSYYLCNTKFQRWIHLRVRIRASHARHRGSNPLSTTRKRRFCSSRVAVCFFSFVGALRCRCLPARVGSPPHADLFRGSFSGLLDCRRLRSVVCDRFLSGLRLVRCRWCGEGLVRRKCLSAGKNGRLVE